MLRWTIVTFATLLAFSAPASAQYIGIFMDKEATTCVADVGAAPYTDLHVVAILEGSVPVMTGAQFRIEGIPVGWSPSTALWVPDAGVGINIGHPLFPNPSHQDTPGVNVAFASCQGNAGEVTKVPLGRIILLGAPTPSNVHLRVVGFELVPTDPDCPFVTDCDIRAGYPKFCVGGGEIVLNGPASGGCGAVAVDQSTWSHIKQLYR
jgi:hypothetical protein